MRKGQKAMLPCNRDKNKNKQDSYLPLSGEKILVTRPKERGISTAGQTKGSGGQKYYLFLPFRQFR